MVRDYLVFKVLQYFLIFFYGIVTRIGGRIMLRGEVNFVRYYGTLFVAFLRLRLNLGYSDFSLLSYLSHKFNLIAMNYYRALYCRQAIAICVNIKNHFQRIKNEQDDKGIVYQINCPLEMPETVPREAILHANRTEWREFDNYLAHIWSLKANDITSNIPICRLDITSQTLGNERSSSSSAAVNSSRRRSASHHLTISMENCDIDNDSMENYVVKRRRKCKIAAPVIDDTDISDENYLANIVHTENYWANCSGPLISAETFNTTMSAKGQRGRKCKGATAIADADAVAVSTDSIADDFLKSSVGTKRSYNTNDSIIVGKRHIIFMLILL